MLHKTANSELQHALKSHERIPAYMNNITNEIKKTQDILNRRGKKLDDLKLKQMVYMFTDFFIAGIEQIAKERYESELQRIVRQQDIAYKDALNKSASGNLTGDFKEMAKDAGLQIVEDRQ